MSLIHLFDLISKVFICPLLFCGQGLLPGYGVAFIFAAAGVFKDHVFSFYFTLSVCVLFDKGNFYEL